MNPNDHILLINMDSWAGFLFAAFVTLGFCEFVADVVTWMIGVARRRKV